MDGDFNMKVFPILDKSYYHEGMDFRDYLASKAMQGICAGDWKLDTKENQLTWDEVASKRAYEIADAMIKAR